MVAGNGALHRERRLSPESQAHFAVQRLRRLRRSHVFPERLEIPGVAGHSAGPRMGAGCNGRMDWGWIRACSPLVRPFAATKRLFRAHRCVRITPGGPFRQRIRVRAGGRVVPVRSVAAAPTDRRLRGRTGSRPAPSGQRWRRNWLADKDGDAAVRRARRRNRAPRPRLGLASADPRTEHLADSRGTKGMVARCCRWSRWTTLGARETVHVPPMRSEADGRRSSSTLASSDRDPTGGPTSPSIDFTRCAASTATP